MNQLKKTLARLLNVAFNACVNAVFGIINASKTRNLRIFRIIFAGLILLFVITSAYLLFFAKHKETNAQDIAKTTSQSHTSQNQIPQHQSTTDSTNQESPQIFTTRESSDFKIPLIAPKRQTLSDYRQYYGIIKEDESRVYSLSVRADGFVEKLFITDSFSNVKKDAPLFTFYSAEIVNAESELLGALDSNYAHLAKEKLRLLGVHSREIAEIERQKKLKNTISYYAPFDGVVFAKSVNVGSGVKKGDEIFRIVNLDEVWVIANIPQEDRAFLMGNLNANTSDTNQENNANTQTQQNAKNTTLNRNITATARLQSTPQSSLNDDKSYPLTLDMIYPQINQGFLQVRFRAPNHHKHFFPQGFVTITLQGEPKEMLTLPQNAILPKNGRFFVFVLDDEFSPQESNTSKATSNVLIAPANAEFMPRQISARKILGQPFYEIIDGLDEEDIVATNALFVLDSDAQNNGDFLD